MKRYLIFAGDVYYPAGGWEDLTGSAATRTDAVKIAIDDSADGDWFHVVDTHAGAIVAHGYKTTEWSSPGKYQTRWQVNMGPVS